jgi:hypothetical protein
LILIIYGEPDYRSGLKPIALLSKYPAKAIEGSRLNWKINLDDLVDRLGEDDLAAIDLTKTLRLLADAKIK